MSCDSSRARLRTSIGSVPEGLASVLEVPVPTLPARPRSVVTTGIGASEGPARILAYVLASAGVAARFCEASRFALDAPSGELLVVFSQGLSPNARLALGDAGSFAHRWLVTSVGNDATNQPLDRAIANGVVPIVIPPREERGTLVRIVGPTLAAAMALRIASAWTDSDVLRDRCAELPSAYRALEPSIGPLSGNVALVVAGTPVELAFAHRWKLLEGLLVPDPPVWDVLQVAHGPLQSFHRGAITLLVLEDPRAGHLVDRLAATLDAERHRLIRLQSTRSGELAFFEYAASLDASLEASLAATPRDLFEWPARGRDEPLYGLGSD